MQEFGIQASHISVPMGESAADSIFAKTFFKVLALSGFIVRREPLHFHDGRVNRSSLRNRVCFLSEIRLAMSKGALVTQLAVTIALEMSAQHRLEFFTIPFLFEHLG